MSRAPNLDAFNAIIAYLREHGQAPTSDIVLAYGQCRRATLKRLQNLESQGIVRTKGALPNKRATMGPMRVFELCDKDCETYQPLPNKNTMAPRSSTSPVSLLDAWRQTP